MLRRPRPPSPSPPGRCRGCSGPRASRAGAGWRCGIRRWPRSFSPGALSSSAVQDARDGTQGDLGSSAGVQPAPHGDGGAAGENGIEPRQVSFKGAKQAVTAFAPKIEAARPKNRPALIDAMLTVIAYYPGNKQDHIPTRRASEGPMNYHPDSPMWLPRHSPRARVGLVCSSKRNFLAGEIPPCRQPAGEVGASGNEAAAEASRPPEPDASRGQAARELQEMVLKLVPFVDVTEAP